MKNMKIEHLFYYGLSGFLALFPFVTGASNHLPPSQGGTNLPPSQGGTEGNPVLDNPFSGGDSLIDLLRVIIQDIVLPIGAVVAVFFIIFSGFLFVTAGGNEEKLKKAKATLLWSVVGTVVLLGSWVISEAIQGTLCQITTVPGLCG